MSGDRRHTRHWEAFSVVGSFARQGVVIASKSVLTIIPLSNIEYRVVLNKLDGVGPVYNRPSTDKVHNLVKLKREKIIIRKIGHLTCDT